MQTCIITCWASAAENLKVGFLSKCLSWVTTMRAAPAHAPGTIFEMACRADELAAEGIWPPQNCASAVSNWHKKNSASKGSEKTPFACSGKTFALLIGINSYGAGQDLRWCLNDVAGWHRLLTTEGIPPECIRMLTEQAATRDQILESIKWLVTDRAANDHLFLTFSGHGSWTLTPKGYGWECCICCSDCFRDWDLGVIPRTDFKEAITRDAGLLDVFLDSCFSGGMSPSYRRWKHLPRRVQGVLRGLDRYRRPQVDLRATIGPDWIPIGEAATRMNKSRRWLKSQIPTGQIASRRSLRNAIYVRID